MRETKDAAGRLAAFLEGELDVVSPALRAAYEERITALRVIADARAVPGASRSRRAPQGSRVPRR